MATTAPAPSLEDRAAAWTAFGLRVTLGVLWLVNSGWKRPPDFGENQGRGLYAFTRDAVEHEVFAPFAWVVREVVLPNFRFFGWGVLLTEAALGAFLLLGLATRFWAVVGLVQSAFITLSVLNTPGEWEWSYYLDDGRPSRCLRPGRRPGRAGWTGCSGLRGSSRDRGRPACC